MLSGKLKFFWSNCFFQKIFRKNTKISITFYLSFAFHFKKLNHLLPIVFVLSSSMVLEKRQKQFTDGRRNRWANKHQTKSDQNRLLSISDQVSLKLTVLNINVLYNLILFAKHHLINERNLSTNIMHYITRLSHGTMRVQIAFIDLTFYLKFEIMYGLSLKWLP